MTTSPEMSSWNGFVASVERSSFYQGLPTRDCSVREGCSVVAREPARCPRCRPRRCCACALTPFNPTWSRRSGASRENKRHPSAHAQPNSLPSLLSRVEGNAGGSRVLARKSRSGASAVRCATPNHAAHPDAREASHLLSPSQSRAGGRGRWAAHGRLPVPLRRDLTSE